MSTWRLVRVPAVTSSAGSESTWRTVIFISIVDAVV
jgi:hypothetical protein